MDKRKGFTLIELMVVILILAILAALIVPRLVSRASDAKVAAAKSDIAEIHRMLEQFRLDTDRYPSTQEGLQALVTAPSDVKNYKGPYTDQLRNDPWTHAYDYEYPGPNGKDSYILQSYGSDGVAGGDGDAADIVDGQF